MHLKLGRILFFSLVIFISINCFSQNSKERLFKIHQLQEDSKYDSALILANAALQVSDDTKEEKQRFLISKAISFYYISKYDSLELILGNLDGQIAKGDNNYPYKLFLQSLLSGREGNYKLALQKLMEALSILERIHDETFLPYIYNSVGANFKSLNEYIPALDYYFKARKLHQQRNNYLAIAMVDNNIGAVYKQLNKIDSALFYYNEASALLKTLDNKLVLAQNLVNLGNIYESQKAYDQALESFQQALIASKSAGLQYGIVMSKLNLGNLYRLRNQYDSSEMYLMQTLEMSEQMGLKREKGYILERLSWLARDRKDFKRAYEWAIQSKSISDSILTANAKKESLDLKEKYESAKQENELIRLKAEGQRSFFIIVSVIMALLFVGILYIYSLYRQKKLLNEKLVAESENKVLSESMDVKDMELTNQALQLVQLKKFLKARQDKLVQSLERMDDKALEKDKLLLTSELNTDKFGIHAEDLETRINVNNEDLYKKLLSHYPDLKPAELKLCAYLRLNLSTKEIADITSKSVRTIEATRYSIRKKMGLSGQDNLISHLINLEHL